MPRIEWNRMTALRDPALAGRQPAVTIVTDAAREWRRRLEAVVRCR